MVLYWAGKLYGFSFLLFYSDHSVVSLQLDPGIIYVGCVLGQGSCVDLVYFIFKNTFFFPVIRKTNSTKNTMLCRSIESVCV